MDAADIIVTSPDTGRPALVAEVKMAGDLARATERLSGYMRGLAAPLGLLVVGRTLRLLRESYAPGLDSIRVIGDFDTSEVEALTPPDDSSNYFEFESQVQKWLESLGSDSARAALPEPLRLVIEQHVVPVIEAGTVRAAGPRVRRHRPSA